MKSKTDAVLVLNKNYVKSGLRKQYSLFTIKTGTTITILLVFILLFVNCNKPSHAFIDPSFDSTNWQSVYLARHGLIEPQELESEFSSETLAELLQKSESQIAELRDRAPSDNYSLQTTNVIDEIIRFSKNCMALNNDLTQNENIRFNEWIKSHKRPTVDDVLEAVAIIHHTETYIVRFDPQYYTYKGVDYLNPKYDPERIGKPLEEIDRVYDYDFEQLAETETLLFGIDRWRALQAIFNKVTAGTETNQDKHLAVLDFLSRAAFHGKIQPMYEDNKTMVCDPLVLLELGEMKCGHVARVACDLFEAAGYSSRLVQVGGHVFSEIYYDDEWHYFDADMSGGLSVFINGVIPPMSQLSQQPFLIDSLGYREWDMESIPNNISYISYKYFGKQYYTTPAINYIKTSTPQEALNYFYGWNYYSTVEEVERILYEDIEQQFCPSPPFLTEVHQDENSNEVTIKWESSIDLNDDLAGYRVYVSTESRGWDWETFSGTDEALSFHSGARYEPEDYDEMLSPLPDDIMLIELDANSTDVMISVEPEQTVYVSIIAYDTYGEKVGNIRYAPSSEIKIVA